MWSRSIVLYICFIQRSILSLIYREFYLFAQQNKAASTQWRNFQSTAKMVWTPSQRVKNPATPAFPRGESKIKVGPLPAPPPRGRNAASHRAEGRAEGRALCIENSLIFMSDSNYVGQINIFSAFSLSSDSRKKMFRYIFYDLLLKAESISGLSHIFEYFSEIFGEKCVWKYF